MYPCASRKCQVHRISPDLSYITTSSDSVEVLVLSLCLFEKLVTAPVPKVKMAPVCPRQSSCVWCEASTPMKDGERVSRKSEFDISSAVEVFEDTF